MMAVNSAFVPRAPRPTMFSTVASHCARVRLTAIDVFEGMADAAEPPGGRLAGIRSRARRAAAGAGERRRLSGGVDCAAMRDAQHRDHRRRLDRERIAADYTVSLRARCPSPGGADDVEVRRHRPRACRRRSRAARRRCRADGRRPCDRTVPSISSSTARAPKRVARMRSKLVGAPPRCRWPSTTLRVSLPVSFSRSMASSAATPPRRSTNAPFRLLEQRRLAADRLRPFGGDDDAEARAHVLAIADAARDLLDVVRDLRESG